MYANTMSTPRKSFLQRTIKIFLIILLVLFTLWLIPAPFKPSPYGYFYEKAVKNALQASSDPVYLPGDKYYPHSTFTAYKDWRNAYEITYSNPNDHGTAANGNVYAYGPLRIYQFTESSVMPDGTEGPGSPELAVYKRELARTDCEKVGSETRYCSAKCIPSPDNTPAGSPSPRYACSSPNDGLLLRTIPRQNGPVYLAARVYGFKSSENAELSTRNINIIESVRPVALADAIESKLKINY